MCGLQSQMGRRGWPVSRAGAFPLLHHHQETLGGSGRPPQLGQSQVQRGVSSTQGQAQSRGPFLVRRQALPLAARHTPHLLPRAPFPGPPGVRLGPGSISDVRPLAGEKSAGIPPSLRPSGGGRWFLRPVWGLSVACTPPGGVFAVSGVGLLPTGAPELRAGSDLGPGLFGHVVGAQRGEDRERCPLTFRGRAGASRPGRVGATLTAGFCEMGSLKNIAVLVGQDPCY